MLSKNFLFEHSSWVCRFIHVVFLVDFKFKKNFNTMSVALLAISYFGTLILLSCNIDPHVKFFIEIILVVQEINLVSQE